MNLRMEPAGETGVIMTRGFAASPAEVFSAHVTPALIRKWMLGPEGWQMEECRTTPRRGGSFRYAYTHADGHRFTISGTYLEVSAPGLIRHREVMEMPEGSTRTDVETRFEAVESGTLMKTALGYPTSALRDAVISEQMLAGMEASYARLDVLLSDGPNSST